MVISNLPNKDVNRVMRTIADSYEEECFDEGLVQGIEQGIEKGMQAVVEKTAINMLKSKLELNLISSVTGLSIDALQKLKASL